MKTFLKEIKESIWYVLSISLAIALIENNGSSLLIEMAGDIFGGIVLILIGVSTSSD